MPDITIIIPFYNRVQLLFDTLYSIEKQTFKHFEVLLIDDGSTLEEVASLHNFLKEFNSKKFIYKKRTSSFEKGANGCRRYGLSISQSPYIKWFDSDDLMKPNFLKKQYDVICEYSLDGVLASGAVYNQDFSEKIRESWRTKVYSNEILKDYLLGELAWPTPSGLWKKTVVEKLQPFSENLKNGQEYIFHLDIITSNLKLGVLNESLFKIRSHSNSISKNKDLDYRKSQFKSRVLTLNRLIYTRNKGKGIVFKLLLKLIRRQGFKNYLIFCKIFFENIALKSSKEQQTASFLEIKK